MTVDGGRLRDTRRLGSATAGRVASGLTVAGRSAPVAPSTALTVTVTRTSCTLPPTQGRELVVPLADRARVLPDPALLAAAVDAALAARRHGEPVWIRCRFGRNRSALVAALVLVAEGATAREAVRAVRRARPGALSNPTFVRVVHAPTLVLDRLDTWQVVA